MRCALNKTYDLTWAYLERCKADNVIHTEIFDLRHILIVVLHSIP
ncbi:hypothetical protein O9992_27530 [Vibrio lentus]|nr:hypothetical protein [Vibrio lentus]